MSARILYTSIASSIALSASALALMPLTSHVDVEFDYLGNGQWRGQLFGGTAANGDPSESAIPSDSAFLAVPDITWQPGAENEGAKFQRPAGSEWDFTGVESGEDLWILTQSDNNIAWPGFENNNGGNLLASYSSDDPRTSSSSRPWIRVQLNKVDYLGRGDGYFALWQATFGSQNVWMSTEDGGVSDEDVFFALENGHDHANWGFSDLGVYIIELSAKAYLGPGMTNPTESEPMPVIAAVGTYAVWQATQFDLEGLLNPEISGDDADPDGDGVVNLLEYALNTSPLRADREIMEVDTGFKGIPAVFLEGGKLAIEFVRRRADGNPQISYRPVFAGSLAESSDWEESTTTSVSPIDDTWERVRVIDSASVGSVERRFVRLEIDWLDGS